MAEEETNKQIKAALFKKGLKGRLEYCIKFRNVSYINTISDILPESGSFFDYGCGDGIFTYYLWLKKPNRRFVGFDIDSNKIREARELSKLSNNKLLFIDRLEPYNSHNHTNIPKEKYDSIIFINLFHHVNKHKHKDIVQFIREKLKKNGTVAIIEESNTPFCKSLLSLIVDNLLSISTITKGSLIRFYNKEYYVKLLPEFNLKEHKIELSDLLVTPLVLTGTRRTS